MSDNHTLRSQRLKEAAVSSVNVDVSQAAVERQNRVRQIAQLTVVIMLV